MKAALISGSSSGIGRAISEKLLDSGIKVIGLARDHSKFKPSKKNYIPFEADLSQLKKLNLDKEKVITTFQSRFGKAEWLQPYTDKTLESFPSKGIKNVAILSPAFSADCLETLEELEVENREVFESAGGEKYRYIPALNDRDDHIKAITALIKPLL